MNNEQRITILETRLEKLTAMLEMGSNTSTAVSYALTIPGVIGVWAGTLDRDVTGGNPGVVDMTGIQTGMPMVNSADIGYDTATPYISFMDFDGTNQAFSIGSSSNNRITGTEGIMASGYSGLTLAAWVRFDNAASVVEPYISLWGEATNVRGYVIRRSATGYIEFAISSAGTSGTVSTVTHTTVTGASEWVFTAARFTPSTELAVWRNGVKVVNTTSIPASIFQSTTDFRFGVQSNPSLSIDGRVAFPVWLSIAAVPDAVIERFRVITAPLFGV